MFHLPHSAFFAPVYPAHSSTNHNQQSRRRSVAFDNEFLRHTSADDLIGARSTTRVTDPAEQAHERLLLAIEEQKAARKAYVDLVSERELARLEVVAAYPSLAALDFHQLSAPESFNLDYGLLLQRLQQRVALQQQQQQQQREQAIIRQRQEEFVRVQRQKVAEEAALRLKRVHEAAHLQHSAALHEQKLEALRQQKLAAHRQEQLEALRQQQLASLRRQQKAEQQRRQQLIEEARHQQHLEVLHQRQLRHRQEAARGHQVEQHQQGPSADDEIAQAIALAVAFVQQFYSNEPKETDNSVKPTSTPAPTGPAARRVRLAGSPNIAPPTAPIPSSSKPSVARTAPVSTPPAIRITIRDSKGKAAAHVRVNSSPAPAPSSPTTTTTSPADAIAALAILASDLDSYLAPEHEWQSEAHRRHALSQLLEQVDAVQSGGEEAVRDVRRALVRRIERALEEVPEEEVVKTKGIVINESKVGVSPVAAAAPAAASPTVAPDAVTDVEGYHVPEFLEATPAVSSGEDSTACPAAPVAAADTDLPETTPWPISQSGWSTVDPTVPAASSQTISFPDEDTFPVPEVTADTPQLSLAAPVLANVSQLDLDNPTLVQYSEDSATKMDDTFIDTFEV